MNENKTTIRKETKQLGNIRAKLQRPLQTENEICAALFAMQDENYRDFHAKLIPNVDKETIIGVRVPHMRAYARTLWKQAPETARAFLEVLPHKYYEENCLLNQAFVKDPSVTVGALLKKENSTVLRFTRYEMGEGLEKKTNDFAAEVEAQMKK